MADDYTEMKSVGEIEGYQVFCMQTTQDETVKTEPTDTEFETAGLVKPWTEKLLPVVEENQKGARNLQEVNDSSPAPSQGVTVKAEPADNGYEITNQSSAEEIMLPLVNEGVHTIIRNQKKMASEHSNLEDSIHEVNGVLTEHNVTALKPQTHMQNHQCILHAGNITEPSGSTEVFTLKNVGMTEKELVEANVLPRNKHEFDSDVICAVSDKVVAMNKTKTVVNVDKIMYWCNFCSYNSYKKEELLQHIMMHRFRCHKCTFQSFSRAAAIQHSVDEHGGLKSTSLKFCALLPDITKHQDTEKRKQSDDSALEPVAKRKCLEEGDTTDDIQDKVASNKANADCNPKTLDITSGSEANPETTDVISGPEASNETVLSMSNSPMESDKTTAITKKTPESSPSAMECLTTTVESSKTSKQSTAKSNITVSSALCWNCGYCSFVTLNQAFLKFHLNAKHAKHPHKYVAILVSSEEEMGKIKASDAQLSSNPGDHSADPKSTKMKPTVLLKSNSVKTKSPKASKTKMSSYPALDIDNAENDATESEAQKTEIKKNIPISYKCAHCNYNAPDSSLVKAHLLKTHVGCVLYGLDMKAVRLKKKRYVFYCLKDTWKFQSKYTSEYLEHVAVCMNEESEFSSAIMTSLNLTKKFIETAIFNGRSIGQCSINTTVANYSCNYCSFKASNIWLKKHVLSTHVDQSTTCSKLNLRLGTTEWVHFCEYCLWEFRDASTLKLHLTYKHRKAPTNPKSSKVTPQAAETKSNPLNEKDDNEYDNEQLSSNFAESIYSNHVGKEELMTALSRYLAEHGTKSRSTRHAALKCMNNMKKGSLPPLYACMHCSSHEYGPKLMSQHLTTKHADEILHATNVLHKSTNPSMKDAFFCPKLKCYYSAPNPADLLMHTEEYHDMKETDEYFQRLQATLNHDGNATVADDQTSCKSDSPPSNKFYQCLYCSEPVFDKIADMKIHLVRLHSSDVFTYRDCFAQKQRQPSIFFMCHFLTCDFNTDKQHDYLLHMLGHQKARIYECSLCQWFSSEKGEIIGHQNSAHEGKLVTILDIDLDLNEHGKIIRRVGGTVIKKENS